jgi:hypothetical protein
MSSPNNPLKRSRIITPAVLVSINLSSENAEHNDYCTIKAHNISSQLGHPRVQEPCAAEKISINLYNNSLLIKCLDARMIEDMNHSVLTTMFAQTKDCIATIQGMILLIGTDVTLGMIPRVAITLETDRPFTLDQETSFPNGIGQLILIKKLMTII